MMNKTWWGEAFVSALEGFIDAGRLQRGRAYRTDRRILAFNINENVVKATVRGNINPYFGVTKEPRYKIVLKFKTISPSSWQKIIKNICDNPSQLSKLMLNELPADIQQSFAEQHLLPKTFKDIEASCSCPDYENPCKHIAGVYFKIANLLDNSPMLLFPLKGLDAVELHQELRKSELGQAFSEHLSSPTDIDLECSPTLYPEIKASGTVKQLNIQQFWGGLPESTDQCSVNPDIEEHYETLGALLKKQGDYPSFWDRNNSFIRAMEHIYSHINLKNKICT